MFLLRSAFMKQWKYTGYIDLEPQEWKKLSWLSVSSVLKLMWHLLNKNSILLVSFQLSTSDEASAGSDLRDTLRFGNQTHQFFFFFLPFADIHLFITYWKKTGHLVEKKTHMALVKQLHRVTSGWGAPAACHVWMFGWRNVLVCISSAPCVCRFTDDKKPQWNGTLCHKMQCRSTGCHATFQLHGNGSTWGYIQFIIVRFIGISYIIYADKWDHDGDVWQAVIGPCYTSFTVWDTFFTELTGSSRS